MAAQIVARKGEGAPSTLAEAAPRDSLGHWLEAFLRFVVREEGGDRRPLGTPRLSRSLTGALRTEFTQAGARRHTDRSVGRAPAHLKTFTS